MNPSVGLPWEVVVIRGIDAATGVAECENHIGKIRNISIAVQRAKGGMPAVGEQWAIDRSLGYWAFAAVLAPAGPLVVTGSRSGGGALSNLLAAMEDLGLIIDGTTA